MRFAFVSARRAALRAFLGGILTVCGTLPAAAAPDDAAEAVRAKDIFAQVQAGKLDRTQLATEFNTDLTPAALGLMTKQVAPYGAPRVFALRAKTDVEGTSTYVYRMSWKTGSLDYTFGVDDRTDKISVLYFRAGPPV